MSWTVDTAAVVERALPFPFGLGLLRLTGCQGRSNDSGTGAPGAVDGSDFLGIRRFQFRQAGLAHPGSLAALVDARSFRSKDGGSDVLDPERGPCLRIRGFGMAGLASVSGVRHSTKAPQPLRAALLAWGLSVMYAVSDEWHQTFVPTRVGTPWDVLIDAAGAALGLALAGLWWRWRRPL